MTEDFVRFNCDIASNCNCHDTCDLYQSKPVFCMDRQRIKCSRFCISDVIG